MWGIKGIEKLWMIASYLFIFGLCILEIEMIVGKEEGFLGGGGCG